MDETPDSLQDDLSSMESQPSFSVAAEPTEAAEVTRSEKPAATEEANAAKQAAEVSGDSNKCENNAQKSGQDQKVTTAPADTPNPTSGESATTAPQLGSGNKTTDTNPKEQKTDKKKSKKDAVSNKESAVVQNANVEANVKQTGQTKQKGKGQQEQKQKPAASEQKMVFGPQSPPKVIVSKMYHFCCT